MEKDKYHIIPIICESKSNQTSKNKNRFIEQTDSCQRRGGWKIGRNCENKKRYKLPVIQHREYFNNIVITWHGDRELLDLPWFSHRKVYKC